MLCVALCARMNATATCTEAAASLGLEADWDDGLKLKSKIARLCDELVGPPAIAVGGRMAPNAAATNPLSTVLRIPLRSFEVDFHAAQGVETGWAATGRRAVPAATGGGEAAGMPLDTQAAVDVFGRLAELTDRYSGADVKMLCR